MTLRDYTANVISASKVVPDGNFKTSAASGVWDINEALDLIKGGNWPNAANLDPASFVDALFSTTLYTGTGSSLNVTTGIDLSGSNEGLVWIKDRGASNNHALYDTVRGATKALEGSDTTGAQATEATGLTAFSSTGFTTGARNSSGANGNTYCAWTFRKQPKFFDIVTYTGNGTAGLTVNHNLGSVPGMIIVKATGLTSSWQVLHRNDGTNWKNLQLEDTGASGYEADYWGNGSSFVAPTSTAFTVGTGSNVNANGYTYVAYLFAHNNNDGGFGEPGDQDIIKCGGYTGNGSSTGPTVNLGFEPQWIIVKGASQSSNWTIIDNMRGLVKGANAELFANLSNSEGSVDYFDPQATGFQLTQATYYPNSSGETYVYMAIRRGGMQTPTSASDVFQATASLTGARQNGDTITTTLDRADWHFARRTGTSYAGYNQTRITGWKYLMTNAADAESSATLKQGDNNNKLEYTGSWHGADNDVIDYFWKRARGFLDIVTYTGTGSARTVSHNLGVVPEMMWLKRRNGTGDWAVYHASQGNTKASKLNTTDAFGTEAYFNSTTPTSSVFTLADFNDSGQPYIAFLMATAAGVSKVGSYTGNGSSQDIDCGFSGGNGASFVMIKNADATGNWVVFDTARGLVAGNDVYIRFDVTNAEGGGYDFIDPLESGFTINQTGGVVLNESGQEYIFWAIA